MMEPMSTLSVSPDLDALLRMGLAVLCGLAVGLNRAHHGNLPHPNRVRVHVLVGLSACLMVLASGHGADPRSRAIQGVAAGVGFLGAGEILVALPRNRNQPPEVRGLSSAASIWFTASLGVTVAASSPSIALVALALALITLSDRRTGGKVNGAPPGPEGLATAGGGAEGPAAEGRAVEGRAANGRASEGRGPGESGAPKSS